MSVCRTFEKFQWNPWAGMSFIDAQFLDLQAHNNNKRARVFYSRTTLAQRDIQSSITRTFLMILEFFSHKSFLCFSFLLLLPPIYFVNFHFRHILRCILQFPSVPKTNKKSFFDNNWRVFQSLIGRIAFVDLKFVWVNQKIDEIRFKMDLMLLGIWIKAKLMIQ